jgi:hypothetical protein
MWYTGVWHGFISLNKVKEIVGLGLRGVWGVLEYTHKQQGQSKRKWLTDYADAGSVL